MTLGQRLQERVESCPQDVCIWLQHAGQDDVGISYAALRDGALRYAEAFRRNGVDPGEVVILIQQHGQELVFAFWGAIISGAIPSIMPFLTEKLSPEQYRSDLKALLAVTRPSAIVTYPEFEPQVSQALDAGGSVRAVISTASIGEIQHESSPVNWINPSSDADIVLLQHSSGTTGLQKGVALSHRAVVNQLEAYGRALRIKPGDAIVSWLPLYHDMGLIAGFLLPLLLGAPLILSSPFDWVRAPWRMLQSVSRYSGTISWLPNFAYNFMSQKVRDRHLEGVDLSSWRAVINCSEPVRWESHRAFFERFKAQGLRWESLQTCYAMAENVFGVTQSDLDHSPTVEDIDRAIFAERRQALPAPIPSAAVRMMSSGRPISNTQVRILDDEGRSMPEGTVGEIALRSDCMLTGYYHRPDADEGALREGWYLTGDYGYLSRGELYVAGRKKDLIIVGGKNIYPQDLEALSYEIPGIHAGRSVAFGVFNDDLGTEDVCMVAEADTEDEAEQQRLAESIRNHVAQHSAITLRDVRVVGPKWILKTSSGKTARAANREKFLREADVARQE
jgi:fatty-acyl-CoA synthase